ncbi:MAG: FtsX-like permease family protein [Actinophytocola sp.]|nr:FtsX-like permease family protein [Actinophytocola sp.]
MTRRAAALWVRGALRRPGRGLLVVGGLLAMVLTVAAAVVGSDTLRQVFVADASAQWGTVDVTVSAPGNQLLGLSSEERTFGEPLSGTGTLRTELLGQHKVIVNDRLARRLGLSLGDRLTLTIAVPHTEWDTSDGRVLRERDAAAVPWRVSVAGIAADTGVADLGRTANVLARLDATQRATGLPGKVSALHADGDTDRLLAAYQEWEDRLGLDAVAVKREAHAIADDESGQFIGIFASLALLVVLGSAALTVNLIVLLGYERSREVALLGAMGATRRTVTALLCAEGAAYTVVATAVGTVLAIPLGRLLAEQVATHFASIELGRGREFATVAAELRPASLAVAVALVLGIGLVTVFVAARRVASLDVERVLRGLPPSLAAPPPSWARRPALAAGAGLLLLGMGITATSGAGFLRFAGLSLLLVAAWLHARRSRARRRLDTWAAAAGLAWFVVAPAALGDFGGGVESGFALLAVAGAGAVTCATVLAGTRLRGVMRLVRGYLPRGRAQAATRTAGAWAEQHRGRSGAVIGLVAVTLFMVGVMSVLGRATAIDVDRQRGGFDAVGTSVGPVDPDTLADGNGIANMVALEHTMLDEGSFATEGDDGTRAELRWPVRLIRGDHELAAAQSYRLAAALPEYPTAAAALYDALDSGDGVVLDRYSTPDGARPGDDVVLDVGHGERTFELLAVADTYLLGGAVIGSAVYDELVANQGPTLVLASAEPGTPSSAVADVLNAAGGSAGLTMRPMSEVAEEITAINATFTDIFATVLQAGLAVALFAVGALVHRATRERRAEFALLRATGFRRRDLVLAVLAEPVLRGVTGIGIGIVAGLGTLALLFWRGYADLAFDVHWAQLGGTAAISITLIVATCLLPALHAARREPDHDLRHIS